MKFVTLLRGINVGGNKRILMTDLRALVASNVKIYNIQTYIQSGNIIFESDIDKTDELSTIISTLIYNEYGFEIPVLTYNAEYWTNLVKNNPFLKDNTEYINRLYVTLLERIPSERNISNLKEMNFGDDRYVILNKNIFLIYYNGAGKSKMTTTIFEKKLEMSATSRNWKTVCKIYEMLSN